MYLKETSYRAFWTTGKAFTKLVYSVLAVTLLALILCLTVSCLPDKTATAPEIQFVHGPRLGLITASTATIYWDTDKPSIGAIEWGSSRDYVHSLKGIDPTTAHRFTLTGLSPASTYYYRIKSGVNVSDGDKFSTAALPGMDFEFITMCDNRRRSLEAELIGVSEPFSRIIALSAATNAAFTIHGGDIFYGAGDYAAHKIQYSKFKEATHPLASRMPFLVVPGNHEMHPRSGEDVKFFDRLLLFNQQFAQPEVLEGYPGTCFSWDWGNSHFACLDSCHNYPDLEKGGMHYLSDEVINWLAKDLSEARDRKVRHICVVGHTNAFPREGHEDDHIGLGRYPEQLEKFWAVLAANNVDAYICGHVHASDDNIIKDGVLQWLNGDSGVVDEPDGGRGFNHWTLWKVSGDTVTAELINDLGVIKHTRVIHSAQPQ